MVKEDNDDVDQERSDAPALDEQDETTKVFLKNSFCSNGKIDFNYNLMFRMALEPWLINLHVVWYIKHHYICLQGMI